MPRRLLFTVQTPLGYRVGLARDRWRQIIRFKHPAMSGRENGVRSCLQHLAMIRQSTKEPDVHLYYVETGRVFLCVVVAPNQGGDHFVVTVYFTKSIKEGQELWKR